MNKALILFFAFSALSAADVRSEVTASYFCHLSNFTGVVPYMLPKVRLDGANREIYVASSDGVRVFNEYGMEVYDFGRHTELSAGRDFTFDDQGNIYVLFSEYDEDAKKNISFLNLSNFKIKQIEKILLRGFPPELEKFNPYQLFYRNGLFYLGDPDAATIAVVDKRGVFQTSYDVGALLGLNDAGQDRALSAFFVDKEGGILFTAPVIARVFRIAPDRTVQVFGKRGSAPGRLGVPSGIVADSDGNILVADKLRSAVIVFDKEFRLATEFGFRGRKPENLIGPSGLAIDDRNRVFISQLGNRGVSVFQIKSP